MQREEAMETTAAVCSAKTEGTLKPRVYGLGFRAWGSEGGGKATKKGTTEKETVKP